MLTKKAAGADRSLIEGGQSVKLSVALGRAVDAALVMSVFGMSLWLLTSSSENYRKTGNLGDMRTTRYGFPFCYRVRTEAMAADAPKIQPLERGNQTVHARPTEHWYRGAIPLNRLISWLMSLGAAWLAWLFLESHRQTKAPPPMPSLPSQRRERPACQNGRTCIYRSAGRCYCITKPDQASCPGYSFAYPPTVRHHSAASKPRGLFD